MLHDAYRDFKKCSRLICMCNLCLWHHSAADSLGSVWGVHIWHDSSGPSPHWYLRHVEVSEVRTKCFVFVNVLCATTIKMVCLSAFNSGERRARERTCLAVCCSVLVGCKQRRWPGGENAACLHPRSRLCQGRTLTHTSDQSDQKKQLLLSTPT